MTPDQIKGKVREFLSRFFKSHVLTDSEDIFALGFVNSLLAMQLVTFVEQEFNISIADEDLDLDNFRSLDSMAALVLRKLG